MSKKKDIDVSELLVNPITHIITDTLHDFVTPPLRNVKYATNKLWVEGTTIAGQAVKASLYLSPDQLIRLYHMGGMTWDELKNLLAFHGIDASLETWRKWVERTSGSAPLEQVLTAWRRGALGANEANGLPAEVNAALMRRGFNNRVQVDRLLYPYREWSAEEARTIRRLGEISADEYAKWLTASGMVQPADRAAFEKLIKVPNVGETLELFLRGDIDSTKTDKYLILNGFTDSEAMKELLGLRYRLPGSQEALHLAARRSADNDIAARLGLDDGLNDWPVYRKLLKAHGTDWGGAQLNAVDGEVIDWAKMHWRAAKSMPLFPEIKELRARLRGDPANPATWSVPGREPWTDDKTRAVLKHLNFPDNIVEQIIGVQFDPVSIRHINLVISHIIRDTYHQDVALPIPEALHDEVEGVLLDHHANPTWAGRWADTLIKNAQEGRQTHLIHNYVNARTADRSEVLAEYCVGVVSREKAIALLVGPECDEPLANMLVLTEFRKCRTKIVKTQIAALETDFITGKTSEAVARVAMASLGIDPVRANDYIVEWTWLRTEQRKVLATGDILRMVRDGYMSTFDALQRLQNIGWDNADALLELDHVQYQINRSQLAAQAKAQSQAARQAQRIATASAKASAAAAKTLAVQQRKNIAANYEMLLLRNKFLAQFAKEHKAYAKASTAGDVDGMNAARYQILTDWFAGQKQTYETLSQAVVDPAMIAALTGGAAGVSAAISTGAPPPTASAPGQPKP